MIELYIRDKKADLSGDESILFNQTRTDYTNPAIVKNSFSKTVSLPGTVNNDEIFENIHILCKSITNTSKFNPSKRTPFVLLRDGVKIEEGYLKLDKIVKQYATHSYECTLYGELGNLLYALSYKTDYTGEQKEMTLADIVLSYGSFEINKEFVKNRWNNIIDSNQDYVHALSFAVCYDGIPAADNFDPKKIWTSVDRRASVVYNNKSYNLSMPEGFTDDDTYYGYINTQFTEEDTDDGHYGLMELSDGAQPIEVRDLRSYLLRPLIRISYILNRIDTYMMKNHGYTLDYDDINYNGAYTTDTFITLPMLYEIYPNIESGSKCNLKEMLKNTGTPASYLVSFCKTFGLYLDIDVSNKTLHLTPIRSFFDRKVLYPNQNPNSIKDIIVDASKRVSISPLSFDKSSYTFDYGDSTGEIIDKYNDKYTVPFGSQKINTGYTLDYSTEKYIQNNIYKTAPDITEQSGWYRYHEIRNKMLQNTNSPVSVMAEINTPTFKLFNVDSTTHLPIFGDDGECETFGAPMYRNYKLTPSDDSWGYLYPDNLDKGYQWVGMRKGVWADSYPRLQFHDSSKKPIDGSNVIVRLSSYLTAAPTVTGTCVTDKTTDTEKWKNYNTAYYILSDDIPNLKSVIGKNCYLDNPTATSYSDIIQSFPLFNRIGFAKHVIRLAYEDERKYYWNYINTLDFNFPQEIYISSGRTSYVSSSVYDTYWSSLVTDIYNINTRILSADCKVDNIKDAFKKFYTYDNCTWILSKVSDYNIETGIGKFEFSKVNDVNNYVFEDGLYLDQNIIGVSKEAQTVRISLVSYGDTEPSVGNTPNWTGIVRLQGSGKGDDSIKKYPMILEINVKQNTAGFDRTGEIQLKYGDKSYFIYIRQSTL